MATELKRNLSTFDSRRMVRTDQQQDACTYIFMSAPFKIETAVGYEAKSKTTSPVPTMTTSAATNYDSSNKPRQQQKHDGNKEQQQQE